MRSDIKSLEECVQLAVSDDIKNNWQDRGADFKIVIEDKDWTVYAVYISYRDILCSCEEGTVTYLVDTYGDRHVPVLHDWERDEN